MSNHLVKAYNDGSGSSGTSYSHQSCWMSRWTQAPSKQGSLIAPHSQAFGTEEGLDHQQKRLRRSLNISSDLPGSSAVMRAQNFRKERSDYNPFFFRGHSRNVENTCASRTPVDPSCNYEANSARPRKNNSPSRLGFAANERASSDLQPQSNLKSSGNFPTSRLSLARKGLAVSKSSEDNPASLASDMPHVPNGANHPSKVMVVERHFSKNNFTSLDQGSSKYEKYSAILVHEDNSFTPLLSENNSKDMNYDPNSELFASRVDSPSLCHGFQPLEELPCSLRNVKAMRICTAVDSVGNSDRGPPLFSQTTTHHFLFTKQAGVNLSKGHQIVHESTQQGGVKIQPLWSSTDSEKDNLGDAATPKADGSDDLSAETDTMDVVALSNKNDFSGVRLSPLVERTMRDKSLLMPSVDPQEDKVRGKLPVTEMPDANSMDDNMEPSTSRSQSLEAEHLLSCAEQPSESKSTMQNKERSLLEPSSMWVKRLKLSSSKVGESSSHEKTCMFFNKFVKGSRASSEHPSMDKHQSEELPTSDQKVGLMMNRKSLSRNTKNTIFQSSWIQRWCQDRSMAPDKPPRKSFVICEPDSSKLPFHELKKKQFPSIAAMALMGKSMTGFRPCKFTRHGPLIIWNTEEHTEDH